MLIERYRTWFQHEIDSNAKMLAMLASVPVDKHTDPRFSQALGLAGHLAACRENWLAHMSGKGEIVSWWPVDDTLSSLPGRFASLESAWTAYLKNQTDESIVMDFTFDEDGGTWKWNLEGQVVQLVGHAHYHRGQIALLVQQLSGEPMDTDYVYWVMEHDERYG